jgi:hypothetical protein
MDAARIWIANAHAVALPDATSIAPGAIKCIADDRLLAWKR